jgi:regulation of enolase protein 1 (concanavalin A-like superfamily)
VPARGGGAHESAGTFAVDGARGTIGGAADQFHFVFKRVIGNVDVRARVAGLESAPAGTIGGVTIRESLSATSPHAFVTGSGRQGSAFERRVTIAAPTTSTTGAEGQPTWVRLVREGALFSSYVSSDGVTWTLTGTDTIAMSKTAYVGLAAASSDPHAATIWFSDIAIEPLPATPSSAWSRRDVGQPIVAGRSSESTNVFSVTGTGANSAARDQFHFSYQAVSGDVEITARLVNIQRQSDSSRAGVMIRETLGGSAAHAFMFASAGKGLAFQRRPLANSAAIDSPGSHVTAPAWVKVVRRGDEFSGYESADGIGWTLVGTETIAMPDRVYVGLAATSDTPGVSATATFTDVSLTASSKATVATTAAQPVATSGVAAAADEPTVTPAALPASWTGQDIGSPAVAGSSNESAGTFTVAGAGADIWNGSDQFHFVWRTITGDVDIRARVASLQQQHPWSKAGVMIRGALSAPAVNISMLGTPVNSWRFQWRPSAGAASATIAKASGAPPGWVRLVRSANTVTGYVSSNGTTWTLVGTQTITLPTSIYVGLAVTSHNPSAASTATFTNVSVTGGTNQAPAASITSPANGATYTAPASITISANASDSDGTISQVAFYQGSTLLGTDTSSPYSFAWSSVAAGTYSLTARATDNSGATTTSAAVSVTVNPAANTPPSVSITSPANGASYTAPASITIAANASDSNGTVSQVAFYQGSALLGTDASSPYSFAWTNVPAGTYALTARATDNGGATTSATVSITVVASGSTTCVFVPSADHDALVSSYTVRIFRAADPPTGAPVATRDIGKPTPSNNEISIDITTLVNPLPSGSYYAVAVATGSGGSSASAPSATFTK